MMEGRQHNTYDIEFFGPNMMMGALYLGALKASALMASHLGEAVTELRSTSPTQMTLVRKSHSGLTALELVSLSRWIESTNFPAFGVFPPSLPVVRPAKR